MEVKKYPLVICKREPADNIVFFEFVENLKIDLEMARELVSNRLDFASGREHYMIIDVSNVKEISVEAKDYFQDPQTGLRCILGSAFIASNPLSALLANIFVKTPLNTKPSRFFSNTSEAIKWIKELRNKNSKEHEA